MLLSCSKTGCDDLVEVSNEMFEDALKRGILVFSHAVCPKDADELPEYRVDVVLSRIVNPGTDNARTFKLAATGASVHAASLVKAFPDLVDLLQDHLVKVAAVVPTAEEGIEEELNGQAVQEEPKEG